MKKSLVSFLVVLVLVIGVFPMTAFAATMEVRAGGNGYTELLIWADDYFGTGAGVQYKWDDSKTVGDLPDGLTLSWIKAGGNASPDYLEPGDKIVLDGTVATSPAQLSGTFSLFFEEYNAIPGPPDEQQLDFPWGIHVCELAVYPNPLPAATIGVPYSVELKPYKADLSGPWCGAAGPNETITYHSIPAGDLPPGLSYDTATGVISGTPTTAGSYSFDAAISGESRDGNNQIVLHQADGDARLTIQVNANIPPNPNPQRNNDDDDDDSGSQRAVYYVIESEAGPGGSITPEGLTRVDEYGSQSYTIKADNGYVIDKVLVDGKDAGDVKKYDFTRVTADHTIKVYFSKEAEISPPETPTTTTYNPNTGATQLHKGWLSLSAVLVLLGGAMVFKF